MGIEVLIGCKFSPIKLRTGTKALVLKIEKEVLSELDINLIVLYASNCIRILIFMGIEVLIGCKISLISWRTGNEPPVLKIAFRGILQLGSVSHRFLRLKLHMSGKFHAGIKFCTIDVTSDLTITKSIIFKKHEHVSGDLYFKQYHKKRLSCNLHDLSQKSRSGESYTVFLVKRDNRSFV